MPDNPASLLQGALFVGALLWAAVEDAKTHHVPVLNMIILALSGLIHFSPDNLYGLVLALPFYVFAGRGRGGPGDVWIVAAASLTLGINRGMVGLIIGMTLFTLFVIVVKIMGKADRTKGIPLVPFLAPGFITAYFI
jgi:leader peptidase (prepilin peptidase)/N-methyltransferase